MNYITMEARSAAKAKVKDKISTFKARGASAKAKKVSKSKDKPQNTKARKVKAAKENEPIPDAAADKLAASLRTMYAKQMDKAERQFNLVSSSMGTPDRLSTGMLVNDLLTGGGLCAGTMYQVSGKEKGAKTTSFLHILRSALDAKIPSIGYWDAENAMNDPSYPRAIIRRELDTVFYGKEKLARLYQEAVLEDFYGQSKALMRNLPDKRWRSDLNSWFFVFGADQEGRKKCAEWGFTASGNKPSYDKDLYRDSGQLWVPITLGGPQGIIFCDSYASLNSESEEDADEEKGNKQMALDARAFSKNIKRVKARLARKGFIVAGTNQIRVKPGFNMGNPEYEPGGEALKFYADVRNQNRPQSVPSGWDKGTNAKGSKTFSFGAEKSVIGKGVDSYAYIWIENTKNKTGRPFLGSMARVWFSDYRSKPHGMDPVFDTYSYLKLTGRILGNRKKFQIAMPLLKGFTFTWEQFKLMILAYDLGRKDLKQKVSEELGVNAKAANIRPLLFAELRDGKAHDMLASGAAREEDADEDVEANGDE